MAVAQFIAVLRALIVAALICAQFNLIPAATFVVQPSTQNKFARNISVRSSSLPDAPDFNAHALALQQRLKQESFTVVIERPFVVIGDEPEELVRQRARDTVRWAVDLLKRDYFTIDPAEILDIWLFKDDESYRLHAKALFGDTPDTPYGYYSPAHKALIMNIATGGGTLVHEIVHPFMRVNFPACPAWFNEGMGSLYEQSAEVAGHIRGRTNWRLAGLQQTLRAGTAPTFRDLLTTTDAEFYADDAGTHYAMARYLCYYLQEKELLIRFYREFVERHALDPSGYKTLQLILSRRDMKRFQQDWTTFVLNLRFG